MYPQQVPGCQYKSIRAVCFCFCVDCLGSSGSCSRNLLYYMTCGIFQVQYLNIEDRADCYSVSRMYISVSLALSVSVFDFNLSFENIQVSLKLWDVSHFRISSSLVHCVGSRQISSSSSKSFCSGSWSQLLYQIND